ncbi:MAG: type II toxin-antitoxin system VapC family toxin [Thermoguttaceae bacterium]
MILLDTSVLIEYFRVKDKETTFLFNLAKSESVFGISVLAHFEMVRGIKPEHENFWCLLLEKVHILDFDKNCSLESVKIFHELKNRNKLIDFFNIAIAATSIVHDMPHATLNTKHFARIDQLRLIDR